jgi:hypothetical protein
MIASTVARFTWRLRSRQDYRSGRRCPPRFSRFRPRSDPPTRSFGGRWWNDFRDGLVETGNANRLARLADLFQDAEALSLELGNGDLFHLIYDGLGMTQKEVREIGGDSR